jgi:hypothetical protein
MDAAGTSGESGMPKVSLSVIVLQVSCSCQFFAMSSEVGD